MAKHKDFTVATDVQVFRDPQSPWQRGTNDNTEQRALTVLLAWAAFHKNSARTSD